MEKNRKQIGEIGERFAEKYLIDLGFELVERNHRNKLGEIDLIMRDGLVWVFVEVKTKVGDEMGRPEEMINRAKLRQMMRVAQMYVLENKLSEYLLRLDMVAVVLDGCCNCMRLSYYKSVC
jgi:putative endonuclease